MRRENFECGATSVMRREEMIGDSLMRLSVAADVGTITLRFGEKGGCEREKQ